MLKRYVCTGTSKMFILLNNSIIYSEQTYNYSMEAWSKHRTIFRKKPIPITLCIDWANISAINHAKSRLNYPIWTIATCKALVGDLESTVKRLTYIKKLVGIFIFPRKLMTSHCLVLGKKTSKVSEFCNPAVSSFPLISNDSFQSGANIARSPIHFHPHSWP